MRTFIKVIILLTILLGGLIGLGTYWTFYRPLPDYNSTISIPDLDTDTNVYWDDYGVPHIQANSRADAYRVLGYLHARDRLWQMTLVQLSIEGRFAEFFGEELVPLDKFQRAIGFWEISEQIEPMIDPEQRMLLQAYTEGVNSFIDTNTSNLPIQFALAEMEPLKWDVRHTIGLTRLLAWELNVSWLGEAAYARLASKLDQTLLKQLIPEWNKTLPTTISGTDALFQFMNKEIERRSLIGQSGSHVGSNAWVVDGSKTETNKPLLAGDPHLAFSLPAKWYEVHISVNGRNLSGATHPGAPLFIMGQNDHHAWTLTNIMADDTDFYRERVNPKNRGQYVASYQPDSTPVYQPFEYRRSYINTKSGDQVVSEVRLTQNGVVISDVTDSAHAFDDQLISMKWTGHTPSNELSTLFALNWSDDFEEIQRTMPDFGAPGQNIMYADRDGNIAMFSVGNIPKRKGRPVTLLDGWNPDHRWNGFIPANQMPSVINPESGWIANANNKITTRDDLYLATFWEPPSRIKRISSFLQSKDQFDADDFKSLQNDVYSEHARSLMDVVLPVLNTQPEDSLISVALPYLNNWDYRYRATSTAATITDVFFTNLTRNILQDEVGESTVDAMIKLENIPVRVIKQLLVTYPNSKLFDITSTSQIETRDMMILATMRQTIAELRQAFGSETYEWRWEKVHTITFEPPLFSKAARAPDAPAALGMIVENVLNSGPYPAAGHGMTVNNAQYNWDDPFKVVLGPSIRRIVDLSDLRSTLSVLPGGQSEHPVSRHYEDQVDLWLQGNYRTFVQDTMLMDNTWRKNTFIPTQ